jgi:hypothetical protein
MGSDEESLADCSIKIHGLQSEPLGEIAPLKWPVSPSGRQRSIGGIDFAPLIVIDVNILNAVVRHLRGSIRRIPQLYFEV